MGKSLGARFFMAHCVHRVSKKQAKLFLL